MLAFIIVRLWVSPYTPLNSWLILKELGDAIEYVGFIEADLSFPMGTHVLKTEALLLVLPTTEYQKRVPVAIGTSLTDMAVDSLRTLDSANLTTPWKTVCCATQSRRKIQAQHLQKHTVKITKPKTLPPFPPLLYMDTLS